MAVSVLLKVLRVERYQYFKRIGSVDFSPIMKLTSQLDCDSGSGKQWPADRTLD